MDPQQIETVESHFRNGQLHFKYQFISNRHHSIRQYWNESGTIRTLTKRQGVKIEGTINGPHMTFMYEKL